MPKTTPNILYKSIKIADTDILLSGSCKASFTSPYNQIKVKLVSQGQSLDCFEVRITKANEDWDIGKGVLALYVTNIEANKETDLSIDINETTFSHGNIAYRVSFYAKGALDGSWDVSYLLFTFDNLQFITADGDNFTVLTDRDDPNSSANS